MSSPFLQGSASWDKMDFQKNVGNYIRNNKNLTVLGLEKASKRA